MDDADYDCGPENDAIKQARDIESVGMKDTELAGAAVDGEPKRPSAAAVNMAMLQEDEERRKFEIESAFSELPTGYDDDDEREMERDFGDTLTDQEHTDSQFSDWLPAPRHAPEAEAHAALDLAAAPAAAPATAAPPVSPDVQSPASPPAAAAAAAVPTAGRAAPRAAIFAADGVPPEEAVPGPRSGPPAQPALPRRACMPRCPVCQDRRTAV